jgi:hypothetical protein
MHSHVIRLPERRGRSVAKAGPISSIRGRLYGSLAEHVVDAVLDSLEFAISANLIMLSQLEVSGSRVPVKTLKSRQCCFDIFATGTIDPRDSETRVQLKERIGLKRFDFSDAERRVGETLSQVMSNQDLGRSAGKLQRLDRHGRDV